jgi:hypothetical protein
MAQPQSACLECGEPFTQRVSGQPQKFCAERCRTKHHNPKNRAQANGNGKTIMTLTATAARSDRAAVLQT